MTMEEKGMTEDEMVGWHYRHNGHGFEWTSGVGDGQGLAYSKAEALLCQQSPSSQGYGFSCGHVWM